MVDASLTIINDNNMYERCNVNVVLTYFILVTIYTLKESDVSTYVTGQLTHCSDLYATC